MVPGRPGTCVNDDRATIEAQRIDWTLDGKNMVADGDVKSVMKASQGSEGQARGRRTGRSRRRRGAAGAAQQAGGGTEARETRSSVPAF